MTEVIDDGGAVEAPMSEAPALPPASADGVLRGPAGPLLTRPAGRALLMLAAPVLAEQFLNLLVGLTDVYLAGTISKEATAAIGLASQVGWLVGLLLGFIGVGATALVSRHAGMGAVEESNHFSNQSMAAAVVMGGLGAGLVILLAPLLPKLLSWEAAPSAIVVQYLRIDALGYLLFSLTVIGSACWRGMGDTRTPLYVMTVVNIVNVMVSAALRFGWGPIPEVGVAGIAIGTVTARSLGGVLVVILLLRGRSGLRLHRREMRFRRASMARLLKVGIPAGIDGGLLWIGQFLFLAIISRLATGELQAATVAAHFVGIRVEALSYLPAFAWATAAATLVGQSLGAGDPQRARHCGHLAAAQGAALCFTMGVLYFAFTRSIYAAFNANEDLERVAAVGVPALRLLAFFQIPLAMMIIYTNALRGAGDTQYPLLFTVIGTLGIRLSVAYVCGIVLEGGLIGAWIGMCADMTFRAVASWVRFVRGKWARIEV